MIKNPILPGFNPDPSICRRGDDYYIATSTFEWYPGIPIYHSRDMKHWRLLTHGLTDEKVLDLRRLDHSKGIWAPCLTWCEADGLFYLVYTIMQNTSAQFFDMDNYVITAQDIEGPWSEPVYLNSSGFDPSIFHDDDGRKWVVNLEWESRLGYEQPGVIILQEYSPAEKKLIGKPERIWRGGTDRGCVEGPHLYKRNGYYYIMTAEGGTGYGHCVTMGRSKSVHGPYESDPCNPIITSANCDFYSRHDADFLKPYQYNPASELQKSGHGSWVETAGGEHYVVHLTSRPYLPDLRCTLGRETAIQRMTWTEDGWLRMLKGGNEASSTIDDPDLPACPWPEDPSYDDFTEGFSKHYYTPRISPRGFCTMDPEAGVMYLRGQESLSSKNRVSMVARKITAFDMTAATALTFEPECFQQSAGLTVYYNNDNYLCFRLYYSESLGGISLGFTKVVNGSRDESKAHRMRGDFNKVHMKVVLKDRVISFYYSENGDQWESLGPDYDASLYSDDFVAGGGFTGAFVGLYCIDSRSKSKEAGFHYFNYQVTENA